MTMHRVHGYSEQRGYGPALRHSLGAFSRAGGSAAKARGFSPAPRHSLGAFSRAGGSAAKARGFTLLEVLVAFALLAIGLGVLLAILSGGVHAVARASQSTQASLYAESILDTLGADQRLRTGHSEGLFEGGRYHWTLDIEPFTPPVPPPQQANPFTTTNAGTQDFAENVMVHVVLRMQWGDRGAVQALRVETLRAYAPPQEQP